MSRILAPALLLAAFSLGSCEGPGVHVEPHLVRTSPRNTEVRVELVNDTTTDAAVHDIRVEGPDWSAFTITNEANPRSIPAGGRENLELRVSRRAFSSAADHGYPTYRSGAAELALEVDGNAVSLPMRFDPSPGPAPWLASGFATVVLLGFVLALATWLRRLLERRRAAPSPTREGLHPLAWGGLAIAVAVLPVGDALCLDLLTRVAHPGDLAQCRQGFGGGPLQIAPVDAGLALWWCGVALFALARLFAASGRGERTGVEGEPYAWSVIGLGAAAVAASQGSLDPGTIARGPASAAGIADWGLVSQPLAFAFSLAACTHLAARRDFLGPHGVAAGTLVALYLGGWTVPVPLEAPHAVEIMIGATMFALKLVLVSWACGRLAHIARDRKERSPHALGPVWVAVALVNLGATLAILGL